MQDLRKIAQLPISVDAQSSILTANNADGYNWIVADGIVYCKRPGLRPVINQPVPDATAAGYAGSGLIAPRGVLAAGEYIIGNQARAFSYEKAVFGSDTLKTYNDTQLVYVSDGRLFVLRRIPVLRFTGASGTEYTYRIEVNSTTGALQFVLRNLTTDAVTTVTITETTKLSSLLTSLSSGLDSALDLVTADSDIVAAAVTPAAKWPTSTMPGLNDLPASCLVHTSGSRAENIGAEPFIYGYVPFEVPFSYPKVDTTYRIFYTQDLAGRDGHVQAVQFQDEMMFAGRGDALMSFDGYRVSVAGCPTNSAVTLTRQAGLGSLSAATYSYILRGRITKPSGQVTYGPPIATPIIAVLNDAIDVSVPMTNQIDYAGSDYSGVAVSPRRRNTLQERSSYIGSRFNFSTDEVINKVKPQVGEYLNNTAPTFASYTASASFRAPITSISADTAGYHVDVATPPGINNAPTTFPDIPMNLGEEWEIYRTEGGGDTYYFVTRMAAGATYRDTMADATLITSTQYVAKPYVIRRPPDCCVAVAAHQDRIVVVGEYLPTATTSEPTSVSLTTNRPYIKNVYWSMPDNEEFNPLNNVILDVTEGNELNSVISVNDVLYVGGGDSLWAITGALSSTANTFAVNRIANAGGTVGNCAITALNGAVFAVSKAGLYQLQGGGADYSIGQRVNPYIRAVKPELRPFIRLAALKKNNGLMLTLPGMRLERNATDNGSTTFVYPSGFTATEDAEDTISLFFDPNTDKWSLWKGSEMYMGGGVVEFDGQTWVMPRKNGKFLSILDPKYGYDGFSTPVEMVLKGPWQHDGDLFTDKNFVRLRLLAAGGQQNFTLQTEIERNQNENQAWQTADLSFRSGEGYGQMPYGTAPYGDPGEMAKQLPLTNQKALSVRAVFKNSNPAEFPRIAGWNFEVGENRKNMKQE